LKTDYQARIIYGDTDSVYFTLPHWQGLDGVENVQKMMDETTRMGKEITKRINLDPIQIDLDHFFTEHCNLSKKFYISNEIGRDRDGKLKIELHFKGVFYSRREHCDYAKDLYYNLTMLGMGRASFTDIILPKEERKSKAEEILWNEILLLLTCQVSIDRLTKINAVAGDYKSQSYPLAIFKREEEKRGRNLADGERVKYFYVKSEEKLAGYKIRRILDPDDVIDRFHYLKIMTTAITKLLEGMFQNGAIYKTYMERINQKRVLLEELVFDPIPVFPREDWAKVKRRHKRSLKN
jgi:DNA polymerase elongation subunit (family B)